MNFNAGTWADQLIDACASSWNHSDWICCTTDTLSFAQISAYLLYKLGGEMSPEFSESPSFIFAIWKGTCSKIFAARAAIPAAGYLRTVFFSPVTLYKSLRLAPRTQIESLSQPSQLINTLCVVRANWFIAVNDLTRGSVHKSSRTNVRLMADDNRILPNDGDCRQPSRSDCKT